VDRRATSAATLAVLLGLCLLGLLFGIKALTSDLPDDPIVENPDATCVDREVTAGTKVFAEDVLVSVYNAGTRSGVASKTMSTLQIRGFAAGKTGNEKGVNVKRVQVWGDPSNPAVQLVAAQFGDAATITAGRASGATSEEGVVVVLGDDFTKLAKKVRSVTAEDDTTICSPFK
jgi:hypothetical protein